MKNRLIPLLLSASLMIAFPCSSYATEIVEPEKPNINNEQQVNEYNKKVDKYNQQIDLDYEEQLNNYNQAIEHNRQEEQKIQETEQLNKAEQERIDAINAQKDQEYQEALEKYDADMVQYENDKQIEEQIIAKGYSSVEEYNEKVNKYNQQVETYNNYYEDIINKCIQNINEAKDKGITTTSTNPADAPIDIQEADLTENLQTILINRSGNPTGDPYRIMVQHTYSDGDFYLVKWEIAEAYDDDIITLIPEKAILTPNDGLISTYLYTDENHMKGYWIPTIYFGNNALYDNDISVIGDNYQGPIYQFCYADGINHTNDDRDICLYYNYYFIDYSWFVPYETRQTYNVPKLPEQPILIYEEGNFIEYLPNFINAIFPIKGKYLTKLKYIPLLPEQTPAAPVMRISTTTAAPVLATTKTITPSKTPTTTVVKNQIPLSLPKKEVGSWALLNLIATICSIILAILSFILFFFNRKKTKEDKENEEYIIKKKRFLRRIVEIVISLAMIIIFILTEDTSLPMVWTDKYTILMLLLLLIHIVVIIIFRRKEKEDKEDKGEY